MRGNSPIPNPLGRFFIDYPSAGNMRIYLMASPDPSILDPPHLAIRDRALGIIATATVLALLYFARDVLVPITLAVILSLLIAPLVRALRRLGLGQTLSVLAAVVVLAFSFGAVAGVIGSQFVRMAASMPRYERTIERKLRTVNAVTVGKFNGLTGALGRLTDRHRTDPPGAAEQPRTLDQPNSAAPVAPIPVELHEAPPNGLQVIERVVGSIWVPIETTGIVLVVLIFVLLEHEALRDRFIRIAGGSDIRLTTLAINDAGERLSRFFVSAVRRQFRGGRSRSGSDSVSWACLIRCSGARSPACCASFPMWGCGLPRCAPCCWPPRSSRDGPWR